MYMHVHITIMRNPYKYILVWVLEVHIVQVWWFVTIRHVCAKHVYTCMYMSLRYCKMYTLQVPQNYYDILNVTSDGGLG